MIIHNLLTQDIWAFQEHTTHMQIIISYNDDILIYGDNLWDQMRVKIDLLKSLHSEDGQSTQVKFKGTGDY